MKLFSRGFVIRIPAQPAGFVIIIVLAVAVQVWAALQWPANYHRDEAVLELMAVHTLQGQPSAYFTTQHYLGSIEATASAAVMGLFGIHVMTARSGSLIFFLFFLIAHAVLIKRLWCRRVAYLSLLLIAFPGWQILYCTCRPYGNYPALLAIFTTALILTFTTNSYERIAVGRVLTVGILVGLGIWTHPIAIIYILTLAFVYFLTTPEWREVYGRLDRAFRGWGLSARELFPWFVACLLALILCFLAFRLTLSRTPILALAVNVGIFLPFILGLPLAGYCLLVSSRRRQLFFGGLLLGAGFIAGSSPIWIAWFFQGIRPGTAAMPIAAVTLPGRILSLALDFFPSLMGFPVIKPATLHFAEVQPVLFNQEPLLVILWLALIVIVVCALSWFFWTRRKTFRSLISLAHLSPDDRGDAIYGLLFTLPLVMLAFAGDMNQPMVIRYLIPALPPVTVILALFLDRIMEKKRQLAYAAVGLWLLFLGGGNLMIAGRYWYDTRTRWYSPQALSGLEDFFRENQVGGVYVDYSTVGVLNFLFGDRVACSAYNGFDLDPSYRARVIDSPIQALIFNPSTSLPDTFTVDHLLEKFRREPHWSRRGGLEFMEEQSSKLLLGRSVINGWDVWLFSNPDAEAVNSVK